MEHDLIERGVPKEEVERFAHDAENTREEAVALRRLAREKGWKSVVVVTSNYHTRRVRYIFQKVFAPGVAVSVASARDGSFDPEHWWEKRKSVKDFLGELVGMVAAVWELRHEGGQGEKSAAGESSFSTTYGPKRHKKCAKKFPCSLQDISAVIS